METYKINENSNDERTSLGNRGKRFELVLLANAHNETAFYFHEGDKVLIVIGGDDQYRDEEEEERTVISRWARRKVASQFKEEYLDGRKSFIFSWDKQHREIHEKALLHYFDPSKKGQKFEYQAKPKPVPLPEPKIIQAPDVDSGEEV